MRVEKRGKEYFRKDAFHPQMEINKDKMFVVTYLNVYLVERDRCFFAELVTTSIM